MMNVKADTPEACCRRLVLGCGIDPGLAGGRGFQPGAHLLGFGCAVHPGGGAPVKWKKALSSPTESDKDMGRTIAARLHPN